MKRLIRNRLLTTSEAVKNNKARKQVMSEFPPATVEPAMRWCEPCRSYHCDPVSKQHHADLQCRRPWSDWQKEL